MEKKKNFGFLAKMYSTGFVFGMIFGVSALLFSFIFGVDLSNLGSSPVWKQSFVLTSLFLAVFFFIIMCIGAFNPSDN